MFTGTMVFTIFVILVAALFVKAVLFIPRSMSKDLRRMKQNHDMEELRKYASMTDDQKAAYQKEQEERKLQNIEERNKIKEYVKERMKPEVIVLIILFFVGFAVVMFTEYYEIGIGIWFFVMVAALVVKVKYS